MGCVYKHNIDKPIHFLYVKYIDHLFVLCAIDVKNKILLRFHNNIICVVVQSCSNHYSPLLSIETVLLSRAASHPLERLFLLPLRTSV